MPWEHVGPGGYVDQDDPTGMRSAGAAQAAVRVGNTTWLLATANGGIWKTDDVLADGVHWTNVLDGQPVACTSISAMESAGDTVVAGCGAATSSEMGWDWQVANSGDWGGVMVSQDAGATWQMTEFEDSTYVSAIVVHSASSFVVSVRSHFRSRDYGGVWVTTDGGAEWTRTLDRPVYDLAFEPSSGALLAALPWISDDVSVMVSLSGGAADDWQPSALGISWDGRVPFYPTFAMGPTTVFLGALTVNPSLLSDTASALYHRPIADLLAAARATTGSASVAGGVVPEPRGWQRVAGAPARLDLDGMPKDRMALLVHPNDESILFVAGNAAALVWRVSWRAGAWVASGATDTADGSAPHSDCRRYYWEPTTSALVLLSDGGAFLRDLPTSPGGRWRSLAGDTGAMELLAADWDPVGSRWIGGAQDNDVMVSPVNGSASGVALGIIGGDGSVTAVDAKALPPRLWGATQVMSLE